MSNPIEASIVVVDDEPSIRELLVASLHFAGFEVNTAASGSEAIEVNEKIQPDLIVLDVMLPDIDGFTVTRRIRQEGITTPVLWRAFVPFCAARANRPKRIRSFAWAIWRSMRIRMMCPVPDSRSI